MCIYGEHWVFMALRYYGERLDLRKWVLWKVPTHPPLHSNEEDIEGLGLWKEEVQALQKALKNQLSLSPNLKLKNVILKFNLQGPPLPVSLSVHF